MINPDNTFWRQREARLKGVGQGVAAENLNQQQAKLERGRKDNHAFLDSLMEALNADGSVPHKQKAVLLNALGQMKSNLGPDPVGAVKALANRLLEQDVSQQAIGQYFVPYIERVMQQQSAKQAQQRAAEDVASLADVGPTNESGESTAAPIAPGTPILTATDEEAGTESTGVLTATDSTPAQITFVPAPNLSEEARADETRFGEQLNSDIEKAVSDYNALPGADGGRIISTDLVRELYAGYRDDRSISASVQEPASAFTKLLYARELQKSAPKGKNNTILFTAGGTGAGKSTALDDVLEAPQKRAQLIYDSNVAGLESAIKRIDQALAAGKKVLIAYVYRDPIDALRGALGRGTRMGRTVPIDVHATTHVNSNRVLKELARHYTSDWRVSINVIDNTRGRGNAVNNKGDLSILPDLTYTKVLEDSINELKKQYREGTIPQEIYDGFNVNKTIREP